MVEGTKNMAAVQASQTLLRSELAGAAGSQMIERPTDNMDLWEKVFKSDPKYVKKVNTRGGFHTPCAQSQIMEATKLWGPMGRKWGVSDEPVTFNCPDGMVVLKVTLWYMMGGDRCSVSQYGSASWMNGKDNDAPKKARTDGTTKCLSLLGFNADIFLGMWDDSKYVNQINEEGKFGMNMGKELKDKQKEIFSVARKLPLQQNNFVADFGKKKLSADEWFNLHEMTLLMKDSFEIIDSLPEGKERQVIETYINTMNNTCVQWNAVKQKLDLLLKEEVQ